MRVDIGDGVRLYFDVDGLGLVPGETEMAERPTMLLLHGGPGFDHSGYKTGNLGELRDAAQLVMYDHRGQGRSDRRPLDELTLDVWADDVVRLCDALEIQNPIVFGASFGSFVAQRYLGRHPEHPSKVILASTAAHKDNELVVETFRRLGGEEAATAAHNFLHDPTDEHRMAYRELCGPHYTRQPGNPFDAASRVVLTPEVGSHWFSGESLTFDTRSDLARAQCPVLVMQGVDDPITPFSLGEEVAANLPADLVTFERFDEAGHGLGRDEPEHFLAAIRSFIALPDEGAEVERSDGSAPGQR